MIYGFNAGEVFRISLDIEENGRLFYEKAAGMTDNQEVKKIFSDLGREEIKHKERFAALMAELPDAAVGETVWDPQNEIDQYLKMMAELHVFRKSDNIDSMLKEAGDAKGALKLAIQFEKDSIVFFAEMQNLSENEDSRKKIGQLVKEEQEHLKRLSMLLRKID